ncbi:MAG: CoA ester lyase [Candidatus Binatia bacterium]|nr:CoA ester lyase [Candidatus Binatia bacterium]
MATQESTPAAPQLRRSLLWVPGDDERKLAKGPTAGADSLVLDLEDAVVPAHKAKAREIVRETLLEMDFCGAEKLVRINPLETGLALDDLTVTMRGAPDGYMIPKVRSEDDIRFIDGALTNLEAMVGRPRGSVRLILLATETPEAILNIRRIAQASLRSCGMMWASEDLSNAIGARRSRNDDGSLPDVFSFARSACLLAAAATGMDPLDMPFFDFHDDEGLEREAREAAELGFTGKGAIHPNQIATINRVFVPSEEEVTEANALLDAATEAFARGQAAFVYKGAMVDAPHINRARKMVARANAAKEKTQ